MFNWGSKPASSGASSGKPAPPTLQAAQAAYSASQLAELRKQKIEQLLRANATIEVVTESQYDIGLQLPDRRVVRLRVTLPPKFPMVAPYVQIMSQATHPWLSTDGECPSVRPSLSFSLSLSLSFSLLSAFFSLLSSSSSLVPCVCSTAPRR